MTKLAKGILLSTALFAVFAVVLVVFGIRWASGKLDEFKEQGPAMIAEAESFGESASNEGCLEEALRRQLACDGMRCQVETAVFLEACLPVSAPTAGFCASVPPPDEFMATVGWSVDACEARGRTDDDCPRLLRRLQDFCHPDQ